MKRMHITFLVFLILGVNTLYACNMQVKETGEEKESYSPGDILILEVTVSASHRNCTMGLDDVQFKGNGIVLLGAKKWEQPSAGKNTRLIKVKIADDAKDEASLVVRRECSKGGGQIVYKVKVE